MKRKMELLKSKGKVFWVFNSFLLSLVIVLLSVGCQSKKNKSNPLPPPILGTPPPNYYNGNYGGALCPTCNVNVPWTIFTGTDSQGAAGGITLSLDFYGDPNLGYYFYDPRIPMMYTGPVVVRGQLTVNTIDPLICSIPVGQYQIISLSAGQWQGGVVTTSYSGYGPTALEMEARNLQYGSVVRMRLAKAVIYNPTGTSSWYPNKLGGTLVFEYRDGMPCYTYTGAAYTELY